MARFDICAVTADDLDALHELARHLDTLNLPADREALSRLVELSEASFSGALEDHARREYVFVLRDLEAGRAVGTSSIIAKLGRRDAPYIYFDVRREEKYSATLDRHFVHTLLDTTYSYDGPTELGGLVVHPDYRGRPEKLGTLVSMVRLLFIGMRPELFEDELLAELLPPLSADGRSHLWEAVGRRFTGLSYREADPLSKRNKEFIRGLFPDSIYATLLSPAAQAVIGEVGPQTRPVAALLERLGFRYAQRVDPFDGGPHFTCPVEDCWPLRALATARIVEDLPPGDPCPGLCGRELPAAPFFQAIPVLLHGPPDGPVVSRDAAGVLDLLPGDGVAAIPLR